MPIGRDSGSEYALWHNFHMFTVRKPASLKLVTILHLQLRGFPKSERVFIKAQKAA